MAALNGTVENLNAMYSNQPPEPPEAQSIKSMLHIARILALIFGILLFLVGLAYAAYIAYLASVCSSFIGYDAYCGGAVAFALIPAIFIVIFGVFDILIWIKTKAIEAMVNQHQYEQAKSATLIWMILGFILGGILIGIILLIAYIKFDPLITAARNQGQMGGGGYPPQGYAQPGYPPQGAPPAYAPPPQAAPPPMAPPPAAPAPVAGAAPFCSKCGKPTTYIAQYGRYYCYDDKIYA